MSGYATLGGEEKQLTLKDEDGKELDKATAALLAPHSDVRYASNSDEAGNAAKWDSKEVCDWLARVGLGSHVPEFRRHQITGRQLHRLTEAHLIELKVELIGERIALQHEICKLHSEMSDALDETVIWSASAVKSYHGPCDWLYKKQIRPCLRKVTCRKPGFLDEYMMTSSVLVVTQRDRKLSEICCGGRQVRTTTRHVQLEAITSATSSTTTATTCDFGEVSATHVRAGRQPNTEAPRAYRPPTTCVCHG